MGGASSASRPLLGGVVGADAELASQRGVLAGGLGQAPLGLVRVRFRAVVRMGDTGASTAARHDQPVAFELAVGTGHGPGSEVEVDRQLADGWQARAGLERAPGDHRGDLLAQLLVQRQWRAWIDLDDHAGRPAGRAPSPGPRPA